jgi:hypothetical protein
MDFLQRSFAIKLIQHLTLNVPVVAVSVFSLEMSVWGLVLNRLQPVILLEGLDNGFQIGYCYLGIQYPEFLVYEYYKKNADYLRFENSNEIDALMTIGE